MSQAMQLRNGSMADELIEFLPGVPAEKCLAALRAAAGKELASGKFLSPYSSSALAVNCFGWFIDRPDELPLLPGLEIDWPPLSVRVEAEMRFPWAGGKHPWLDAAVETADVLVGIEAKRFEPFRDRKAADFSDAYDRDVWGSGMSPYVKMRDRLRCAPNHYRFLDAAQLVKHALGLVTQARKRGKQAILFYLYAEPGALDGRIIKADDHRRHREEVAEFGASVAGAEVSFHASSYAEWLATWGANYGEHAQALRDRFHDMVRQHSP